MSPRITGRDGAPMVLVPAGEFTMGSDDGDEDERPVHKVYLDAFYIDQYEVTTSRYADFMERSRPLVPAGWNEVSLVRDRERPVHGLDWFKADVYCRFYGKRLPTEAEWEKAARGTDGRKYPWGNEDPTSRHANFNRTGWKGYTTLTAVTEHEVGKSPYGVYDMAGNVEEWVSDWYSKTYYQKSEGRNPTGPNTSTGPATSSSDKILRGGDWASNAYYLRSADRQSSDPTDRDNNNRNITNGFRCAKTP
jgi:formylglycine-generating enzyme required for sulfatase activity